MQPQLFMSIDCHLTRDPAGEIVVWFDYLLESIARSNGLATLQLIDLFCSESVEARKQAYEMLYDYTAYDYEWEEQQ